MLSQYNAFDLWRIAIDESNRLLASSRHEISRVTLMGTAHRSYGKNALTV
jgi:hypothetical protein